MIFSSLSRTSGTWRRRDNRGCMCGISVVYSACGGAGEPGAQQQDRERGAPGQDPAGDALETGGIGEAVHGPNLDELRDFAAERGVAVFQLALLAGDEAQFRQRVASFVMRLFFVQRSEDGEKLAARIEDGLKHMIRKNIQRGIEGDFETGNMRYKARERYSFGWSDYRGAFGSSGNA